MYQNYPIGFKCDNTHAKWQRKHTKQLLHSDKISNLYHDISSHFHTPLSHTIKVLQPNFFKDLIIFSKALKKSFKCISNLQLETTNCFQFLKST